MPAADCRALHTLGVIVADRERLFHHHRDFIFRASLNRGQVIEGICEQQHDLRFHFGEHRLNGVETDAGIKFEIGQVFRRSAESASETPSTFKSRRARLREKKPRACPCANPARQTRSGSRCAA